MSCEPEASSGNLSKPEHRDALLSWRDRDEDSFKTPGQELVLYSPQYVARLEKAGLFPKRVKLGPNREGWVESEVLDWLEQRLAQREVLN